MKTLVVLLSMVIAITAVDLPSGFKVCSYSSPHLEQCLAESAKTAIEILAKGDRTLKILPVDPLTINYMLINGTGQVSLTHEYRNMKILGLSKNMKISVKVYNTRSYYIEMFYPRADVISEYKINGKILVLPIRGEGNCKITLYNITLAFNIKHEPYEKDGETYLKTKKLDFHLKDIKNMNLYFENLFDGNKQLGDEMNKFINENAREIFNEIKPAYEKALKQIILKITNNIFSQIPEKKLFPPE